MNSLTAISIPVIFLSFNLFIKGQETEDKNLLQGKWKVVLAKYGSLEMEKRFLENRVKIEGNSLFIYDGAISPDRLDAKMTFTLNPRSQPKQIDLHSAAAEGQKTPLLGIYALEKGILKLSWSKIDGKFRPESFELPQGKNKTRQVSLVLERMKEK